MMVAKSKCQVVKKIAVNELDAGSSKMGAVQGHRPAYVRKPSHTQTTVSLHVNAHVPPVRSMG
jgi:hypothetical protein